MNIKKIIKELEKSTFNLKHNGEMTFVSDGYVKMMSDTKLKIFEDVEKKCKKCLQTHKETIPIYSIDVVPLEVVKELLKEVDLSTNI